MRVRWVSVCPVRTLAQNKDDSRLRINRTTNWPRFTRKIAVKMVHFIAVKMVHFYLCVLILVSCIYLISNLVTSAGSYCYYTTLLPPLLLLLVNPGPKKISLTGNCWSQFVKCIFITYQFRTCICHCFLINSKTVELLLLLLKLMLTTSHTITVLYAMA